MSGRPSLPGSPTTHPMSPTQREPARADPALDRPRLATDSCKNIDLPPTAFALNYPSPPKYIEKRNDFSKENEWMPLPKTTSWLLSRKQ
ncbi:hypothetical protein DTO271D3_8171 [Paecilomyces variotii]|nr:hypothetical protein DTO169E5_6716 [Paecilomyces variotii]KAJ9311544.1 hypothetical protein DTO271D3_8171 [Paecilomyces variotii]